jgi:hypothetical protein
MLIEGDQRLFYAIKKVLTKDSQTRNIFGGIIFFGLLAVSAAKLNPSQPGIFKTVVMQIMPRFLSCYPAFLVFAIISVLLKRDCNSQVTSEDLDVFVDSKETSIKDWVFKDVVLRSTHAVRMSELTAYVTQPSIKTILESKALKFRKNQPNTETRECIERICRKLGIEEPVTGKGAAAAKPKVAEKKIKKKRVESSSEDSNTEEVLSSPPKRSLKKAKSQVETAGLVEYEQERERNIKSNNLELDRLLNPVVNADAGLS